MEKEVKLNITDCLNIVDTGIIKDYNVSDDKNPYFGKQYRIFSYLGKAFSVLDNSPFTKDFDNDNIDSVILDETAEGLSFISHVSITRAERAHITSVKRKALTVEFIQTSKIMDLEELA